MSIWTPLEGFPGTERIEGKDCTIELTPRPYYCDRGNFLATIDARGELAREMDWADGWPRYYFDLARAKAEIEAWLQKRGQALPDPTLSCGHRISEHKMVDGKLHCPGTGHPAPLSGPEPFGGPWRCYAACGKPLKDHCCAQPFEDSSGCDVCPGCIRSESCRREARARICRCTHSFADHSNSDGHHRCSRCDCRDPQPPPPIYVVDPGLPLSRTHTRKWWWLGGWP